jgi:putative transposase
MKAKIFTGEGRKGWFWGKKKIRVDADVNAEGIYSELGMKVKWAIPYNAKSKQIERFFKTLRTEFSVHFRSYRGKNVTERPEDLQKRIRKKDVVSFEELKEGLHSYLDIKYSSQRKHRGKGMENRTPNEVFYALKNTKRAIKEDELMLLCAVSPKDPVVKAQGIWLFKNWYWDKDLVFKYLGRRVRVRHSETDISKVYVSERSGKFICIAKMWHDARWIEMESEDYRKFNRFKKHIKEYRKGWEENHIPVRMSDSEREALVVQDSSGYEEPELEPEYIRTKYADIIAGEEIEKMKEKEKEQQISQSNQFFTSLDEGPSTGMLEKEVDGYILEFAKY